MRHLLLFRHAEAERSEPGMNDHTRVLTAAGREEAARIGAYLASHSFNADRIAVSTAVRAQQTWACVAAALPNVRAAEAVERLYDATPGGILDVIMQTPAAAETVLVVAHNPGLHELALLLTASGDIEAREHMHEKFPTCGLAIIEFPVDAWSKLHPRAGRLERFISPKLLAAKTN